MKSVNKPTYQELENQIFEFERLHKESLLESDRLIKAKGDQYRMLFDSMPGMVQIIELIYDKDGKPIDYYIRDINPAAANFYGKTKSELLDQKISSFIDTVEDYWMTTFASVEKTGTPITYENYGVEFDKYYSGTVWKAGNNRLVASYSDITEIKERQKRILESQLRLEEIEKELNKAQKLAHIGSWLFNPVGQKAEWSEGMFHVWGFDPKKGTPNYATIIKRIHSDDFDLYNRSVEKAASIGTPYEIEFRIWVPNDGQKVIKAICQPLMGDNGEVIRLTGTTQDITSNKLLKEAHVKHQRLKALGEMSSSIAHDFNNSLQEIMGNLEVIKLQNAFSDSSLERINNIESIINDVADRVSGLQKFGDTRYDDKNTGLIDFNALIEESLKQSQSLWKAGTEKGSIGVAVRTDFLDIPKIKCNKGELKSAIYNIIKNSMEAMPEGGDLLIKTGVKDEVVYASFTDTGIGMDEETQLKIFQPFYSTKGLKLGRGLGMSGAYRTVKNHKGSIEVKSSELSIGTTIEITFPIIQEDEIIAIEGKETKDKDTLNVLWVDDDAMITEFAHILVESIGHQCHIVDSGKNALEYLKYNICDVVFTDIGMSEMNGWELSNAIRHKFGNEIKIIAVTGWEFGEKIKEKHCVDFVIQKPFTLEDLEKIFLLL